MPRTPGVPFLAPSLAIGTVGEGGHSQQVDLTLVSHTFTGFEPAGTYTWFAFLTRPGAMELLGPVVSASVTFAP